MKQDNDLKTLFPDELLTLSNGEEVKISPLSFADLILHSDLVASIVLKIDEMRDKTKFSQANDKDVLKLLFREAAKEVLELMIIVTGKPREWFSTIRYDEGLAIFSIIYEQNIDENAKKNLKRALSLLTTSATSSKS